jgi:hypothetical protein
MPEVQESLLEHAAPTPRPESQAELMTCAENSIQAGNQDGNGRLLNIDARNPNARTIFNAYVGRQEDRPHLVDVTDTARKITQCFREVSGYIREAVLERSRSRDASENQ